MKITLFQRVNPSGAASHPPKRRDLLAPRPCSGSQAKAQTLANMGLESWGGNHCSRRRNNPSAVQNVAFRALCGNKGHRNYREDVSGTAEITTSA
jgi:hypothetical protein